MTTKDLLSRIQGCLAGVAIGDAMGMAWETLTPEEILAVTGGVGVTTFHSTVQTRFKSMRDFKAGDTTDDWQLTAALARSLIRSHCYDELDCAREFVCELDRTTAGWGGSTKTSVAAIKKWFEESAKSAFPYPKIEKGRGTGNGVAMRIAPLAIFHTFRRKFDNERFVLDVLRHGEMTHADPRASVAAYAVALFVSSVLKRPFVTLDDRLVGINRLVMDTEFEYGRGSLPLQENFHLRLHRALQQDLLADPVRLRQEIGTSCFCIESVPFSIATFLRHPTDFRAGVLEAVNAGGDTDSNASMVGAMIGANVGLEGIPAEWLNFRPEFQEALRLGEELYRAAHERG